MRKFFKKLIKKHIRVLKGEREEPIKLLKVYPEDSFSVAFLYFGLKWLDFKISIWETLINE
jgi:hypothetical protein